MADYGRRIAALNLQANPAVQEYIKNQGMFVSAFPSPAVEPDENTSLFEAFKNVPFGLAEEGRNVEQAVRDPIGLLKGLGRLAVGAVQTLQFGPGTTPASQELMEAGGQVAEQFERENFIRNPVAPIATIAGAATPFLPTGKTGLVGALSKATRVAGDPVQAALGPASKLAGVTGRGVRKATQTTGELVSEIPGFTTGAGSLAIQEAFKAGFEGRLKPFLDGISDKVMRRDVAISVRQRFIDLKKQFGETKDDFITQNRDLPVSLDAVQQGVFGSGGTLEKFKISVVPRRDWFELDFPEGIPQIERNTIEAALGILDGLGPSSSLLAVDEAKKAMDLLFRQATTSGALTGEIRGNLRAALSNVQDAAGVTYDSVTEPLAKLNDSLDSLQKDVSLRLEKKPFNPKVVGRALERGFTEGAEDEFLALGTIEEITGQPGKAKMAGQRLSSFAPAGLVGRSEAAGLGRLALAGGALGGGAIAGGPLGAIVGLTVFSPYAVGVASALMGSGAGKLARAAKFVNDAKKAASKLGIAQRGLTFAELYERIQEEQTGGVIGRLNRSISRSVAHPVQAPQAPQLPSGSFLGEGAQTGLTSSTSSPLLPSPTSKDTIPQRAANPGDIKPGGIADQYALRSPTGELLTEKGHLRFPDAATGFKALAADVEAKLSGKSRYSTILGDNPSIDTFGSVWAEDPMWAAGVARILGLSPTTSVKSIPRETFLQAIARQEGFYTQ